VEVSLAGRCVGEGVVASIDPGQTVNPLGVRNQTEGGIQQSASWTLKEELLHRDGRVINTGWDSYPIATFRDAPESIEVFVEGDESAPQAVSASPERCRRPLRSRTRSTRRAVRACGSVPLTRERVRKAMAG